MKSNGRERRLWWKIFFGSLALIVFINEVLIYQLQSYRWPSFPEIDRESGKYQVLLLIGDPQLQGYQDEPPFPIGTIARWDIDRYLWKTFSAAYHYSQPDVLLFLGDLMDEGSKATSLEYAQTLDRFQAVFPQTKHIKTIYIPGDNDVGGEGRDFIAQWKVDRYQKHFGNTTNLQKFGFIDYVKLDLLTHGLSEEKIKAAERLRKMLTSPVTVLVNHKTIMMGAKYFIHPISRRLKPKIVFSAHHHKAMVYTCSDCLRDDEYSWSVQYQDLTYIDSYVTFDTSRQDYMVEIALPTCSYRMGMADMGYGVAIIGEDGRMHFTVLWLPRRYTMLLGYLITSVTGLVIAWFWQRCRWKR